MTLFKYSLFISSLLFLTSCQAIKLIKTTPVELNEELHIVLGGGGNSAVLFNKKKDRVLIVDTKNGRAAKKLKKWIRKRAPNANITIINTHFHKDHIDGNKLFLKDKGLQEIIIGNYTDQQWSKETKQKFSPKYNKLEKNEYRKLIWQGENVHIFGMGGGHTWNDIVVYFEKAQTLMTGDLVFHEFHPVLKAEDGTNLSSWIFALNDLLIKFTDPRVVPGHGSITTFHAVHKQIQYFSDLISVDQGKMSWEDFKKTYKALHKLPFYSGYKYSKQHIDN